MTDELADATPTCGDCLVGLQPSGTVERPYWVCPGCGAVAITVGERQ